MKQEDFHEFTNDQLREIKVNLNFFYNGEDISEYHDIEFNALPTKLKLFLTTPNKSYGNLQTRRVRCINLLDNEIVRRFTLGLL